MRAVARGRVLGRDLKLKAAICWDVGGARQVQCARGAQAEKEKAGRGRPGRRRFAGRPGWLSGPGSRWARRREAGPARLMGTGGYRLFLPGTGIPADLRLVERGFRWRAVVSQKARFAEKAFKPQRRGERRRRNLKGNRDATNLPQVRSSGSGLAFVRRRYPGRGPRRAGICLHQRWWACSWQSLRRHSR